MANIFISYNRQDEDKTKALVKDIEELGHTVWFDHELSGGQKWWDTILESIRDCDVLVFALSIESLNSSACGLEYDYASKLGKTILPVLVGEGVSINLLPPVLSQIQFVDYQNPDRDALLHLAKALTSAPPSQPLPDPLPLPPEVPISYLGKLGKQIGDTSKLSYEEQSTLLLDLKRGLHDPETTTDTRTLLKKLRKRQDLLENIAREIDELLEDVAQDIIVDPNKNEEILSVTEKKDQKQDIGQNSGNHGKIIIFVIVLLSIAAGVTYFYFGQNHQADKVQSLSVSDNSGELERAKKKLEEFKHKKQAEAEKQRTREEERRKQETKAKKAEAEKIAIEEKQKEEVEKAAAEVKAKEERLRSEREEIEKLRKEKIREQSEELARLRHEKAEEAKAERLRKQEEAIERLRQEKAQAQREELIRLRQEEAERKRLANIPREKVISFSENGIDIHVTYPSHVSAGQKFKVTAKMTNNNSRAKQGGLTLSFPDMKSIPGRSVYNNFSRVDGYSYPQKIWNEQAGKALTARYFMLEGWQSQLWPYGRTKSFSVELTAPNGLSQLKVNLRGILWIRNKNDTRKIPLSSYLYDQQGYAVKQFTIKIQR
ncbi:MAG: hypothetical protein COB07_08880 [Sulfurovum sp.]|nr:MAG: hypothetical protein COB07_08880 [Sulfurovum sp.]